MEIWKDVVGFERAYQVSSLGRIKSKIRKSVVKEKILKPFKNNNGYECVDLLKMDSAIAKNYEKLEKRVKKLEKKSKGGKDERTPRV